MVNPRKGYPVDPGLIPLFDASGQPNVGHSLETCVMLELERRGAEVSYVRNQTGSEVDFLVRYPDGRRELLQVCADVDDADVLRRELRGLADAQAENKNLTAHLIVLVPERPANLLGSVHWHSASEWLLDRDADG